MSFKLGMCDLITYDDSSGNVDELIRSIWASVVSSSSDITGAEIYGSANAPCCL